MNVWWVPVIVAGTFAAGMLLRLLVLWLLTR